MSNYQIDHPALYPSDLPDAARPVAVDDVYMSLQPTEKAFVDAYLSTMGESAKAAGIALSETISREMARGLSGRIDGRANRMLQMPRVQAAIHQRAQAISAKFDVSSDRVMKEVAGIAFSNMAHYLHIDKDGIPYFDLSRCTVEQMAAISEITVEELEPSMSERAEALALDRPVKPRRKMKLKLHNKLDGLDKLMKFLNLYAPERHEHVHTVKAAVVTANMTPEQLADIWSQRMKQS